MTDPMICTVYRSPKRDGMFLYVNKRKGLAVLPESLHTLFGEPERVMEMLLTADKKLARVDAKKVLDALIDDGYFLQMPPPEENLLQQHRRQLGLDDNA